MRLVSLHYFVLTVLPQKSLVLLYISSVLVLPPEEIEIFHSREFSFFVSAGTSRLKSKEILVLDHQRNCSSRIGYYTAVFVLCDSVRVDTKSTSSYETEDVCQEELFFTLGKVLAM